MSIDLTHAVMHEYFSEDFFVFCGWVLTKNHIFNDFENNCIIPFKRVEGEIEKKNIL